MKIIKTSENVDTRTKYKLTMDAAIQKMTSIKGQQIEVSAWALYSDEKNDGKTVEIVSIMTPEGEVFATNSATFKEDFFNMLEMFAADGEPLTSIRVITGTSKAGREFITCALGDI